MSEKLKPCPFCGQIPKVLGKFYFCISCENPDCMKKPETRYYHEIENAVIAWNKRAEAQS